MNATDQHSHGKKIAFNCWDEYLQIKVRLSIPNNKQIKYYFQALVSAAPNTTPWLQRCSTVFRFYQGAITGKFLLCRSLRFDSEDFHWDFDQSIWDVSGEEADRWVLVARNYFVRNAVSADLV